MRFSWILAGLALLVPAASPLRAEDDDHANLLAAFKKLRDDFQKELPRPKVITLRPSFGVPKPNGAYVPKGRRHDVTQNHDPWEVRRAVPKLKVVKTPLGGQNVGIRAMVKVWAEVGLSNDKAHLTAYEWKPKQQLYLCFEATRPMKIGLFQHRREKGTVDTLLPDADVPLSFDSIPAGKPHRLPILMEMDDNDADEHFTLVVVAVGSSYEPFLKEQGSRTSTYSKDEANKFTNDLKKNLEKKKLGWASSAKGRQNQSHNADDVAVVAYTTGDAPGAIEFTMKKAR
jgi:hypothetical protein